MLTETVEKLLHGVFREKLFLFFGKVFPWTFLSGFFHHRDVERCMKTRILEHVFRQFRFTNLNLSVGAMTKDFLTIIFEINWLKKNVKSDFEGTF